MKVLGCLLLACLLCFSACGNQKTSQTPDDTNILTSSTEETKGGEETKNEEKTPDATPAPSSDASEQTNKGEQDMKAIVTMKTVTVDKTDANKPVVTIEMMSGGIIKAELYPEIAPITVENFVKLIDEGFYNGLTFHRNIPGFVIQGGCPLGNGTGGPGYHIKGEFASNGVENNLKHTRGVLSMARAMDPNSAGSQFFIMHADAPHLDGDYAAFGKVIEGMDTVDQIANS